MNKRTERSSIKITSATAEAINIQNVMYDLARAANNVRDFTASMDAELLATRKRWERLIAHQREKLQLLTLQAKQWADAHPEQFAKRKTLTFPHGQLGFRTPPPKLELLNKRWTWDAVTSALSKSRFWAQFIRRKPEIDKETILKDLAAGALSPLPRGEGQGEGQISTPSIAAVGLKVTQGEAFFIKPKLTPLKDTTRVDTGALVV